MQRMRFRFSVMPKCLAITLKRIGILRSNSPLPTRPGEYAWFFLFADRPVILFVRKHGLRRHINVNQIFASSLERNMQKTINIFTLEINHESEPSLVSY